MATTNRYLTQQAATITSPITFTASAGVAAAAQANVQKVIDALAMEGASEGARLRFIDQMDPAARLSLVSLLLALKASIT